MTVSHPQYIYQKLIFYWSECLVNTFSVDTFIKTFNFLDLVLSLYDFVERLRCPSYLRNVKVSVTYSMFC